MASPLSGSLATQVYKAFINLFLDATLTRDSMASNSPDISFDPTITTTSYTCKAMPENYSEHDRLAGLVTQSERKILILANSLSVTPTNGDRITLRSKTFTISDVQTDPALAVWTCKAST